MNPFAHRPGNSARHIVVADEDPKVVALVVGTLRRDGHAVLHAHDALAAIELALTAWPCDLVIRNSKVGGARDASVPGVGLVPGLVAHRACGVCKLLCQLLPRILLICDPFAAPPAHVTP